MLKKLIGSSAAEGLTLCFISVTAAFSQNISGRIVDEKNHPVPFANIFIQEMNTGVSSDDNGKYFIAIDPGIYHLVITSVGYETKRFEVKVPDKPLVMDFTISSSSIQLNAIEVKARRRDPAYEIIKNVIRKKESFKTQVKSTRTQIYLKAYEVVDRKKQRAQQSEPVQSSDSDDRQQEDPFEVERKKELARLAQINLLEMQLTLNYQYPDLYKEERTAYKLYGSKAGLFVPVFSETDFNFYYNLVHLKGISEVPLISPLSSTAVLSYKYKLEETLKEGNQIVYRISVTPRKIGDATCSGTLFINDSTWNINRLDVTLYKGALKFYDKFTISQTYREVENDFWIPSQQQFRYETASGGKIFKGETSLIYSEFERNYPFSPKFFGNEVSVTTAEALTRDSAYWNNTRPQPLTDDQKKVVTYRDSLESLYNSKAYKDSVQAKYNRVTVGELLYHGVGFRNHTRRDELYVSPLISLLDFAVVGGFRLGPYASYFRRYKSERWISTSTSLNVGLKNMDWQGSYSLRTLFNPYRLGWAGISFGREFYAINSFDAYLNQLKISNFIVRDYVDLHFRKELVNGLYVTADAGYSDRRSLAGYDATSIINEILDETAALDFKGYQALITNIRLSYTPFQQFMTEPHRKIVLGSRYPTFHVDYRKGWNRIFGSDVNFDFLALGIDQSIPMGTLGTSKYSVQYGKFTNTRLLPFIDLKRFRQSDPFLFSDPMHSFQLLDTALSTTDWFFEMHWIHYFNGAMINNIPLVKKLRLRTVAGAGTMWLRDSGVRHGEIFGGIERIFKVGARRRLKLGMYGVLAESNFTHPVAGWKFSIDLIDTWKRDWSY